MRRYNGRADVKDSRVDEMRDEIEPEAGQVVRNDGPDAQGRQPHITKPETRVMLISVVRPVLAAIMGWCSRCWSGRGDPYGSAGYLEGARAVEAGHLDETLQSSRTTKSVT